MATTSNVGASSASTSRPWKIDFRDWNEFFSRFSAPETADKIQGRLQVNLEFYAANYAAIVCLVFIVAGIAMPNLAIAVIIPAALTGATFLVADGHLLPGGLKMNNAIRYSVGLLASFVVFLCCHSVAPFVWTLTFSVLICGAHALLKIRPPLQANIQKLEKQVGQNLDAVSQSVGQSVDSVIQSTSAFFKELKRKAE